MNYLNYKCVRIDWKGELADTYYLFKTDWIDKKDILEDEKFISLVENYDSEVPPDYLPALGQEFSTYNICLYNIIEDGDHYCLVLIDESDKEKFEKLNKSEKVDFELLKQQRKKWGKPATRLKLSERIPYEKLLIEGFFWTFNYPVSIIEERLYNEEDGLKQVNHFLLDTQLWPLKSYKSESAFFLTTKQNYTCAIFNDEEEKKEIVKVSQSPFELDSWTEIIFNEKIPSLTQPFWANEDLLIMDKKNVWLVKSALKGNKVGEKVFEAKNKRMFTQGEYPNVFNTLNGQTYILLYFKFYKWVNQKLKNTGLSVLEHYGDFNTFPTGNFRFVYMANGKLIEVDFRTKKTRSRQLEFIDRNSSIQIYNKDWAVITRIGYTDKNLDIAQFWQPKTDTWIRMSLGKLGKNGIRDIFSHPKGYTLINTNDNLVLKVDDLLGKLKSDIKNTFSQPTWDKKWKDESQFKFWDKLKSIIN